MSIHADAGRIIRLTSWTDHNSPMLQVGYKAPKGKVMVAIILGEDDKKMYKVGPREATLTLEELGFRAVDDQLLENAKRALNEYEAANSNTKSGDEMYSVLKTIISSVRDRK